MIIDADIARELSYGGNIDEFVLVKTETLGETRWGIIRRTIFMAPDRSLYAFEWEEGATEHQDYDSFDDVDTVEAYRVIPVQVTVTEYHKP